MNAVSFNPLHAALLDWFARHGRNLPWRETLNGQRDPYRVWVSEVLLQQTQVARGRVYFERFMQEFPTVQALAAAPIEAVLKAWEGCGYYARARHLHQAAQLVAQHGLPSGYEGWRALPGVGAYTAAAIASLAHGEARAVNDGNVRRVLARLHGERAVGDAWVQARADQLLYREDPGRWNEALMDLGATVCTPKAPRCGECPWRADCAAFASGAPTAYPAPKKRAAVREVQGVALLIGGEDAAYLETRDGKLLGGLSGLPIEWIENGKETAALDKLVQRLNARSPRLLGVVTHALTHRHITWFVYAAEAQLPLTAPGDKPLSGLDRKAFSLAHQVRASWCEV